MRLPCTIVAVSASGECIVNLIKSFNAKGAENLVNSVYNRVRATNFFCGDEVEAKRVVTGLVEDVGFEAVDVGPLRNARFLESLTLLWVSAVRAFGTREIAFKMLRRGIVKIGSADPREAE